MAFLDEEGWPDGAASRELKIWMVRNWNRNLFFSLIWIAVTIPSVYLRKTPKEYNTVVFCFLTRYLCWINACFCVLPVRIKIICWNALSGPPVTYEESSWKPFFISLIINQCFSGIAERNDSRILNLTKFLDELSNLRFSFIPKNFLALLALNPLKQSNLSQTQSGSRPLLRTVHTRQPFNSIGRTYRCSSKTTSISANSPRSGQSKKGQSLSQIPLVILGKFVAVRHK